MRSVRRFLNDPAPMIWEPEIHGRMYPDRPYFLRAVRTGMNRLSPELQVIFREASCKAYVCRRGSQAIDLSPKLSALYARQSWLGRQAFKSDLNSNEAFAVIPENRLFIPQSHAMGTVPVMASALLHGGVDGIVVHESGHLFDRIANHDQQSLISGTDEYKAVLQADIDSMSRWSKNAVFLHIHGVEGLSPRLQTFRIETFAQLFAESVLGRRGLSKHMPATAAYVAGRIDRAVTNCRAVHPDFDPQTYPRMTVGTRAVPVAP